MRILAGSTPEKIYVELSLNELDKSYRSEQIASMREHLTLQTKW
jgi:hypothetical protein